MHHREPMQGVGFQTLTVDNTAGGVALTVPAKARRAMISVETAAARFTDDGTAPTTTTGQLVNDTDNVKYLDNDYREALLAFRAIRTTATSSTFQISYYS